ncbi:MAG: NAD(P)-binding protein, partial [Treponema sp.]|nr:NAD(P)-binding protein [Treponema sp.]
MTKYLILGAGPAGLALANSLLDRGETDFLVVEKEAEAGGLCRSRQVDGSPLDIGGGHFLDVRRPAV